MRTGARLSALAVGLFLALPALAADVAGKWTSEFDSQIGVQKYTFDLKVDGEKVTGMFDAMGSSVRIEYKGTVEGDEIAFTRQVGEFATEQIVARRSKD
jgi:hypothetical protein